MNQNIGDCLPAIVEEDWNENHQESISFAHSVKATEEYEIVKVVLQKTRYLEHPWLVYLFTLI